jgi:hypothetical protein
MPKVPCRARAVLLAASILALSSTANADSEEQAFESLFREGRRLLEAGDCTAAIPKFRESLRLAESVGAHISLAECYEKEGRLVEAWREDKLAESIARKKTDQREEYSRKHAAELEGWLGRVKIAQAPRPGLTVTIDGSPVGDAKDAEGAVFLTAGTHRIDATAPGAKAWSITVEIASGQVATVNIRLESESKDEETAHSDVPPKQASGSTQRTIALTAGGLGALGLAVGGVAGLLALGSTAQARNSDQCEAPLRCTNFETYNSKRQTAYVEASVSTAGFIAGGALLATGAILWFTAPSARTQMGVRATARGAVVEGRW